MISTANFEKSLVLNMESQLWIIIDFQFVNPGKGSAFVRTKLKNLRTGKVIERTFKSGEQFEQADVERFEAKFMYAHRGKFGFCETKNPANRFELTEEQLGSAARFLKLNEVLTGMRLKDEIINIDLPIKVQLKVIEAAPGEKGGRAQAGTKTVTLETGVQINVPLFVEQDDIIEVNTETGEYAKRVE